MKVEGQPVPLLDEDLQIIGTVPFKDNLTLSHVPEYVNYNGYVGLTRLTTGRYQDSLVIMYYDKKYPQCSYAELVTEKEAYRECLNRGKLDVAKECGLELPPHEREII